MADKDKIEKIISMGTEVDTSNGEKQLNDFINKNRVIKFDIEPTKSAISNALKKIQSEFNEKKTPVYFDVAVRKSSISKAMSDLREEISKTKPITVSVVPKMDVNSSQFAGKNNIARIKNYIQSLLKDVEVKLTPKFDMKSITASIRNMKQELNKVAGGETEVKTNIIVNRSGNVGSPEALDSWLKSLRKFANFATKVPNGEINLRVNLGANIDAGFKQLIEGGLDLSKIKGGKLDINVNGGDSSTGGNSRRKGGNGKGTISDNAPDTIPEPQIIPAMTRSKIIEVINKRFNTDAKNLVEAIEKSSGINLSSAGRNIGVHIQSAMSKLAKEAEDRVIQGDKEGAQAIKNLVGKLRNMYAGQDPYLRETGKFTNLTDGQVINRYTKLATQDSNVSLDSGRYAQIDASNKERRAYLDNLKREQELFVKIAKDKDALWKHGAEQLAREIEALWETNKRLFKNNKSNPQVESKLAEVHNLQNRLASGDADVASAAQKYFANKAKEIANLLEYAKAENSEILEAFRISGMQGINTTKVFNNLNPLNHGEKLENLASQRANMSGDYWAGAEHKRKANELRKERLDPLQKEIDDLIVARNKGEKSQLGTNPELLNLINTKLRLMSEIGGADFGLKQQIDYIKSLKNKNIDADAHGMLDKLLNQMNKELAESFRGTIEDRIKYYKKQISEAFKQIKDKAGRGEDVTSDVNKYMGFRSKLLEAQSQQSGGASADYSGASKGMSALANIKGIDSKLLADIKQAETEFRELAKAQSAAGDTAKKLSNEYESLKNKLSSVTSNGDVSKIASKMESNLMARFGRGDNVTRDIQALSQMATALNSKGLDGEPIARLARRMQELAQQAKQVTQAEQQSTKAQTAQNQAVIVAERELEELAKKLDNAYRAETALSRLNPFSKQTNDIRNATAAYQQQLEKIYRLRRELGLLRSDGDAAKELLGRSGVSGNRDFLLKTNGAIQGIFESVAGQFARSERYSRDRANRTSFADNFINAVSYGTKFAGRSAKGTGSALEASAMGLKDAFNLATSSTSMLSKGFGVAGMVVSTLVGGFAMGIEAISKLINVFGKLFDVVSRLLQPGIELYTQVTKATYSMGAAIASNTNLLGDLASGIATSANLQKKAMFDAERSVFDFGEIMTSLSGTLPLLLGRGMTLDEAYRTNLGVASVAKLTNLAPNQVLQETRDLAQGTITARSSQVANALGISSEDIKGKSSDDIVKLFEQKFSAYEEVLKRYAETPVGAFEQVMDRMKVVSMQFVESIAFPFKEVFNYLTDLTGSWVDSAGRTYSRINMGDGTTEQFFRKFDENGNEIANDGANYTLQEVLRDLNDNLFILKDAIEKASTGEANQEQKNLLANYGVNADSLVGNKTAYVDVFTQLFGDVFKPIGEEQFNLSEFFEGLRTQFVDIVEYISKALDELIQYIANAFGIDLDDAVGGTATMIKYLIDMFVWCVEVIVDMISGIYNFGKECSLLLDVLVFLFKVIGNCCQIFLDLCNIALELFPILFHGFETFIHWISAKLKSLFDPTADTSAIDARRDNAYAKLMGDMEDAGRSFKAMGNNFADIFNWSHVGDKEFHKFEELFNKGKDNEKLWEEALKQLGGKAKDPTQVRGTPKNKVDEKALREARKAEKKAFDKYIAQLREALEKHIQDLKDLQEKNEVYYKQGLTNYSDYITNKINYDIDEQKSKRDELLAEREAIQNTGKYESEDDREKDLANNQKELDKVDRSIGRLESVQSETSSILKKTNGVLANLSDSIKMLSYGLRGSVKGGTSTSVSTANLTADELLGMNIDMNDVDAKRNWAMDYIQSQGYSLQQATGIMGNLLTESRTLNPYDTNGDHWGIVQWDKNRYDSVLKFANSIGTDINDAMQFFKAQVRFMVQELGSSPYNITPDSSIGYVEATKLVNKKYEVSGEYSGKALQDRIDRAEEALANYRANQMNTITTKKDVNIVDSALNGMNINDALKAFEGDTFVNAGANIADLTDKTKQMLLVLSSWHKQQTGEALTITSGYREGSGSGPNSHGSGAKIDVQSKALEASEDFILKFIEFASSLGAGAVSEYYQLYPDISEHPEGSDGYHIDVSSGGKDWHNGVNNGGFNPMANKELVETLRKLGIASTEDALKTLEKSFDYILKPFELLASISKYTNPTYGSMEDLKANSAEYMKGWYKLQKDILTTTGVDDKQQAELRKYVQDLGNFQLQEIVANNLKKQLESQLEDAEALFDYDVASSASRLDFNAISDKYKSIFTNMDNGISKTIETIQQAIKEADESGNKTVAKDLRQALNKFTSKLIEFFNKAEEAITKQYEYVETALNNIGATDLQKEGISRRFNLEKNKAFAEMYRSKETNLTSIYRQLVDRGLKEAESNGGEATAETLRAIAEVEEELLKNHWALQQAEELSKFKTALEEANDVFKQSLEDGLVDFMTDGVNSVLEGTKTIGEAFRELAVSILKTMQQFFAKRIIEGLMNRLYPTFDKEKQIVDTANWQPKDLLVNPQMQGVYNQQMNNPQLQPFMKEGYVIKNPVSDVTNAYDRGWRPEYEALNPADMLAQKLTEASGAVEQFKNSLTGEWQIRDENDKKLYPDGKEASTSVSNFASTLDNASTNLGTTLSTLQQNVATAFDTVAQNAGQVANALADLASRISSFGSMGGGYATGGYIKGPGTSTSDSIPAMLSNSEYVISAKAVKKYGTNFLDAVNNGTFATIKPRHHYASGGLVTETAREATSTVVTELGRGIGTNINNEAHFNLVMASNQEDAMKAFMRSPEGQRIYLDMARKYASTTVRF